MKVLQDPDLSMLGMGDGRSGGPYPFLEHVTQHLATLTYFGEATDYSP